MDTTPAYADVSLETSQPNPRMFCYNLKNHLRIKEEHMWLYGHAMLKTERQSLDEQESGHSLLTLIHRENREMKR